MPGYKIAYGLSGRAEEKQRARDADDAAIASGLASEKEVARRNNLFASFDLKSFNLSGLGGRPMKNLR